MTVITIQDKIRGRLEVRKDTCGKGDTQGMAKRENYKVGEHPNSLANLNREGRPKAYGSEKKQRYLSITEEGWEGAQAVVRAAGYASLSDLIEQLGRGHAKVVSHS